VEVLHTVGHIHIGGLQDLPGELKLVVLGVRPDPDHELEGGDYLMILEQELRQRGLPHPAMAPDRGDGDGHGLGVGVGRGRVDEPGHHLLQLLLAPDHGVLVRAHGARVVAAARLARHRRRRDGLRG